MNAASWPLRKSILILLAVGTAPATMARTNDYEAEARQILDAAGGKLYISTLDGKIVCLDK
jgi:hypothetical protein